MMTQEHTLSTTIQSAFETRNTFTSTSVAPEVKKAVETTIHQLDTGTLRVAEQHNGKWQVHEWIKQAILLYFKLQPMHVVPAGFTQFYDKIPLKFAQSTAEELATQSVRIVPMATARKGCYIAPNVVLMPSFINIGAYVDSGTMVDTWATVGSCAQIGKNVHLSGGVGIGGVLEPIQANPTIIEDNCFIGARSEIVEGVIVERNAVISMGVFISQSTPIYDRTTDTILYGRVPAGAVVVPGTLPKENGKYHLSAAIIVKYVDEKTRQKTSINEILRQH